MSLLAFCLGSLGLLALQGAGSLWAGSPPAATHQEERSEKPSDYATGDWGGLRDSLAERGVVFNFSYIAEGFGVLSGGRQRGALYNGLLDLGVDVDLEKLLHWPGAHFHVNAIYPHGQNGTLDYVQDLGSFSNLEAYDAYRLYEAWLEQDFFNDRFSIRAGLITFDSEFQVLETYGGLFVHSSFGVTSVLALNFPIAIYPLTTLGLRVRTELGKGVYFQAAVFDGNPAPALLSDPSPNAAPSTEDNHFGTHLALRHAEGALLAGEFGWRFNQVEGDEEPSAVRTTEDTPVHQEEEHRPDRGLAGAYKIGFVYHTDAFADVYDSTLAESASSLTPTTQRDGGPNYAIYVNFEQELWREPKTEFQGLGCFAHGAWAPPNRSQVDFSIEGGVHYRGLWAGRDEDALGLGAEYLQVSREVRRALVTTQGANGGSAYRPDFEVSLEVDYRCQLTTYLYVQPHVQYVIHPGGTGEKDNALIVGVRTSIAF